MIIQSSNYTNVVNGALDESKFSFEFNGIAAYTLMAGIAKNRIAYPIRELCTNAWDVAGGDFDVRLPSVWDPTFCVRDYGPGLSHDEMKEIYTRFFASTKRDTNDQVGGLGLGCKSPLAYIIQTDASGSQAASYMVRSFQDGSVKTYTMSLSEGGMPIMRLLDDSETDERDGLEVSFTVRREDIDTFKHEARLILWSFEPRPRTSIMFEVPQVVASAHSWTSYVRSSVPWDGPHVRMGCVMYPIDLSQLNLSGFLHQGDTVLFETRIGSLTVQTSRESLGYDDRTKATLEALIETYERERIQDIENGIAKAETIFQADRALTRVTDTMRYGLGSKLRLNVRWKGQPIPEKLEQPHMLLGKGWTPFDKFSKFSVQLNQVPDDVTVAIEHHPYRSFERLTLAGLVGKPVLWIRCPAAQRDTVLNALHLSDDDVVFLDKIKVEAPKKDKKLIRVRVMEIGDPRAYNTRRLACPYSRVDASEGCIFVRKVGKGYHTSYKISDDIHQSPRQFEKLIDLIGSTNVFRDDPISVCVLSADDPVDDNWFWLGEYLELRYKDLFDPSRLSTIDPSVGIYSLDSTLRGFGQSYLLSPELRPDLKDLITECSGIVAAHSNESRFKNTDPLQETILGILKHLDVKDIPSSRGDGYGDVILRCQGMLKKYPLVSYLIKDTGYYLSTTQKERLRQDLLHYSELLNAHDSIQHH